MVEFNAVNIAKKVAFEYMEPLEYRCKRVESFLRMFDANLLLNIVSISDPYGPTKSDPTIEALAGSDETKLGCQSGK